MLWKVDSNNLLKSLSYQGYRHIESNHLGFFHLKEKTLEPQEQCQPTWSAATFQITVKLYNDIINLGGPTKVSGTGNR